MSSQKRMQAAVAAAVLVSLAGVVAARGDVTVYTTAGELVRGTEVKFDAREGFSLDVPGQARRTFALADLVFADFGEGEGLDKTGDIVLRLRNGDSLRGAVEDGNENEVSLRAPLGTVKVAITALDRLIVAPNLPRPEAADGYVAVNKQDTVYKKTPKGTDIVSGTLDAFTRDGIVLDWSSTKYPFKFPDVVAIALVPQGKIPATPRGAAYVSFRDGSRLTGALQSIGVGNLEMDWMFGKRLRIPLKHVAALTLSGDRFAFASDMEPKQVVQVPAFGGDQEVLFPWRRDRSVGGGPLQISGLRFAKGLGMHARTELAYAVDGGFSSFTSLIGIDDETRGFPARGTAIFRVVVDGQKKFEARVSGGATPERIPPLDVRGAKEVRLVVDFADDVGAGARGDWGNAIFLK
ncbi:MAG: NPCBM/NEW2 domain-containing protein [Planctomycetes bacterium]|nr:NPCBM/NEW2 domain-containing protein [Planctomycetota bacterium]MBI3848346.1 NPCBM/NEW2 domain-containing protein [Planctomycetota bacterium]